MAEDVRARFQKVINAGRIHGGVLCATNSTGSFAYTDALGQRTLLSGEKKPQEKDDILCLGMATSLVTTVAALQCVDKGILSLTGDISVHIPELANKQVITGFSEPDDEPLLEPASEPITLEMLLTHSSGASYQFLNEHVGRWRTRYASSKPEDRLSVEETNSSPLGFQPGGDWMFGPGYDWAGRLVERATGKTLQEYVQDNIFAPLGISDAEFYPVAREDLRGRQVDLNPDDPDGLGSAVLGGDGVMNKSSKGNFGGQGLFMSGVSFTKILRSLLANDGKLLSSATVDSMFENHLGGKAADGLQKVLSGPFGPVFCPYTEIEVKVYQGLGGLVTQEDIEDNYGSGTMHGGGAMSLVWFIDRKNDLCAFGAVQTSLKSASSSSVAAFLKDALRKDIYTMFNAWKKQGAYLDHRFRERYYRESLRSI